MKNKILAKIKFLFFPSKENEYYPEFLKSKFLLYFTILLFILKIITLPFFIYFPKNIFFADLTKTVLFELTNRSRESLGYQPLRENPVLNKAALLKAMDMLEKDYFSHQSPEGLSPWYWLKKAGYSYQLAGENLAIGFLDSEEVFRAWMESLTHKKNILNPDYQEIGIAVVKGDFQGNETNLVVQFFGTPKIAKTVSKIPEEKKEIPATPEKEKISKNEPLKEAVPKEEIKEKEIQEIKEEEAKKEEVKGEGELVTSEKRITTTLNNKSTLGLNFLSFLNSDYYNLLQKIIYGFLILIVISLFITVFFDLFIYRAFSIEHKGALLKTVGFCLLLVVLLFFDKVQILKLIPHNFNIGY